MLSTLTASSQDRFRVIAYALDGQYRTTGDMGTKTFQSIFIGSGGARYAVVQRTDGRFQHINIWETTEDSGGTIYPAMEDEFDDEDTAVVAASIKSYWQEK